MINRIWPVKALSDDYWAIFLTAFFSFDIFQPNSHLHICDHQPNHIRSAEQTIHGRVQGAYADNPVLTKS